MQKQIITLLSRYKRKGDCIAVLFIAFLTGLFFYRTVLSGKLPVPSDALVGLYHPYRDTYSAQYPNGIPFKNFLITDPVRQQIPWRKTVIENLKQGKLPVWDAYAFSGTPLLGNIQSGVLYPLNIVFLFLPFAWAWTILVISQPLLAGVFLYLFLRNKRLEIFPSLFGALCFAFSGFSIAWLTWGTILSAWAWTPLALLSVDKLHDYSTGNKNTWRILFVLAVVCSFFAGHLQIFAYSILFISLYSAWMYVRTRPAGIPLIHIGIALCIVLFTSPVWFPVIRWLPMTGRLAQGAAWTHEGFFIPPWHLVQFFAPDYFGNPATLNYWGTWNYGEMVGYIGVGGLILAGIGIAASTSFWTVMTVAALLFAVDSPYAQLPFRLHIPVLSTLQPTRLLVIVDFCLSVLAAYGLSGILKATRKKKVIIVFVVGIIFVALWVSVVIPGYLGINGENALVARRNMVLPTVIYVFTSIILFTGIFWVKIKKYFAVLPFSIIIIMTVFDLFRFGWKFTPFTDAKYFFPTTPLISYLQKQPRPFRIMTMDDRILPPNVNEYYGIESVAGYDPIHGSRYEEFIAALERGNPDIRPPFGFERIMAPKNIRSPLVPLLNIRYVLTFDELTDSAFKKVFEEGTTKIYELTRFVPRVYLAQKVSYNKTKQEIFDTLYKSGFTGGLDAVTETHVDVLNIPLGTSETASITSYTDNEMTISAQTDVPRLLVILNQYDNTRQVSVDDKVSELVRVNYIFTGVVLQPGSHMIKLRMY